MPGPAKLTSVLDFSPVYRLWDCVIGGPASRRRVVENYVRAKPGNRILDIGCGPGNMVCYFPDTQYSGFDPNPDYIATARARYADSANFDCGRVATYSLPEEQCQCYDLTLAFGVLHHLDNEEAEQLFRLAHTALKPGGRLITYDGCYVPSQSRWARKLLSWDRGRYVRSEREYVQLASTMFGTILSNIHHDLLKIPYTMLILECER